MTSVNVALIGGMASGKTTLMHELEKLSYFHVRSYTTRPKRIEELDTDYEFCTDSEFTATELWEGMIAKRSYQVPDGSVWKYGLCPMDFDQITVRPDDIQICDTVCIVDPKGYLELRELIPNVFGVLLEIPENVRIKRALHRGDDKNEILRRIMSDRKDFEWIYEHVDEVCSMQIQYSRPPEEESNRIDEFVHQFKTKPWPIKELS